MRWLWLLGGSAPIERPVAGPVAAVAGAVCLAACIASGGPLAPPPSLWTVLPAEAALAGFPTKEAAPAVRVLEVQERRTGTALLQRIVLENTSALPGENQLTVRVHRDLGLFEFDPDAGAIARLRQSPERLGPAIEDKFAGGVADGAPVVGVNPYGRYLAVPVAVRGSPGRCVYAWQVLAEPVQPLAEIDEVGVELRYCGPAGAADRPLMMFDRLELRMFGRWRPHSVQEAPFDPTNWGPGGNPWWGVSGGNAP